MEERKKERNACDSICKFFEIYVYTDKLIYIYRFYVAILVINLFISVYVYLKEFANGINYIQGSDNELWPACLYSKHVFQMSGGFWKVGEV